MDEGKKVCGCPHHKMIPLFIIIAGVLLLGGNLGWWGMNVVNWWPLLLILGGFMKMMKGACKCC